MQPSLSSFSIFQALFALSILVATACGPNPVVTVDAEGVESVSLWVEPSQGATLRLSDGAELVIPPLALAVRTEIFFSRSTRDAVVSEEAQGPSDALTSPSADGDAFYEVLPSMPLRVPATLRLPFPMSDQGLRPAMYSSSTANEMLQSGGEMTQWKLESPSYDANADIVTLTTKHFTGFQLVSPGDPAYLVLDLPGSLLEPGDILMTLTRPPGAGASSPVGPGPNWIPGHVGLYVGPNRFAANTKIEDSSKTFPGAPDIIEAVSPKVHASSVEWFRQGFHDADHLYLGARRPPPKLKLSTSEKQAVAELAVKLQGRPYALLGDAGSFLSSTRATPLEARGYSCVGLADTLYDFVGKSLASWYDRAIFAVTPKDMMEGTIPVDEIAVPAGKPVTFPVYGVIRKPGYFLADAAVPYGRQLSETSTSVTNSYTMELVDPPPGATLTKLSTEDGYQFSFEPKVAGEQRIVFRMRANVTLRRTWPLSDRKQRTADRPIEQVLTVRVR